MDNESFKRPVHENMNQNSFNSYQQEQVTSREIKKPNEIIRQRKICLAVHITKMKNFKRILKRLCNYWHNGNSNFEGAHEFKALLSLFCIISTRPFLIFCRHPMATFWTPMVANWWSPNEGSIRSRPFFPALEPSFASGFWADLDSDFSSFSAGGR